MGFFSAKALGTEFKARSGTIAAVVFIKFRLSFMVILLLIMIFFGHHNYNELFKDWSMDKANIKAAAKSGKIHARIVASPFFSRIPPISHR
jgi:hypothetical protein